MRVAEAEGREMMGSRPWLKNKYWVLRHGKSIPNEKGLIVSSLVCILLLWVSFSTNLR